VTVAITTVVLAAIVFALVGTMVFAAVVHYLSDVNYSAEDSMDSPSNKKVHKLSVFIHQTNRNVSVR
jgi:hypothetical protein